MSFETYEFDGDPSEADKETLVDTLTDFKEKHDDNAAAFEELQEDLEETQGELEDLDETVTSYKEGLAAEAAENTPLNEEELATFDLDRLAEIAEDATQYASQESEETPEDPEGGESEEPGQFEEGNPPEVAFDYDGSEESEVAKENMDSTFGGK